MRYKIRFFLLHCLLPIVIGALAYLILSPDAMLTILFKEFTGISICIEISYKNWLLSILRNYGADFLWGYSFMTGMLAFRSETKRVQINSLIICCAVTVLMELGQLINPFFTFDVYDILIELLAVFLCLVVYRIFYYNKNGGNQK